jgi:hypothetical protein
MIRTLEYLAHKDKSLLIKYDFINQMIQYPNKILYNSLSLNGISRNILNNIGVCLCEKEYYGFKCDFKISKNNNICENKNVISCNRETSVCRPKSFTLNNIFSPREIKESFYESYHCECNNNKSMGLNCEYKKNQCNYYNSNHSFISFGSIFDNSPNCNATKNEFCYPLLNISTQKINNSEYNCLAEVFDNEQILNYLIFDEKEIKTAQNESNSRLNLNDSGVLIALQNFIKDIAFKHYIYNDYVKLPKGPLALLSNSIKLKPIVNDAFLKLNKLIQQNNSELVKDTMLNRFKQQFSNKLVNEFNNNWSMNWNFSLNNIELNMLNGDPNHLIKSLDELKSKIQNLDSQKINLFNLFSLNINSESYLNYFDISEKDIEILKLDILPGIYLDSNEKLIIRPTPGLFYRYLSRDLKQAQDDQLLFLPGIFNPITEINQEKNSIFSPGIMSLPIDDFDIKYIEKDENYYLNKFKPIQIPFNLKILNNKSNLILTPIDSNSNYEDLFNKKLNGELNKLINDQKQLSARTILSTVILSNPTMSTLENIEIKSAFIAKNDSKKFSPKGAQFFDKIKIENAFIQPYIFYDIHGNPIPRYLVQKWLEKYCKNYKGN